MPLSIQGTWNVQVIRKDAALDQRFIISGATVGNGIYAGEVGTSVQVSGNNWLLNIQADGIGNDQPGVWFSSEMRRTNTQVIGNNYVFEVESEDYIQDYNWTDLVLRFTQPIPPPPPVPLPPPPIIPQVPQPIPVPPPAPEPPPFIPEPPKPMSFGRVYTLLTDDDKLPRQEIINTYGIWLDYTGSATGNLVSYFTCSLDTGSFKKSVYNSQCFTCSSKPHFDIAYGHDGGSGSRDLGGFDWLTPSNAVYGQYRSLCLDPGQKRFKMGSKEISHFYAINVHRDRMGDRLDEGNIEINLHHLSGSQFLTGNGNRNAHTGSNVKLGNTTVLRLIDDTKLDLATLTSNAYSTLYRDISSSMCHLSTTAGKVFYMVSGTLEEGIFSGSSATGNTNQPHVYGLSFPQQGIIILDADMLDLSASFLTVTGSDVAGDNSMKLFTAMSGAALRTDASGDFLGFQARKLKYEYVEQYFVRVKNQEYNFTNNPTYVTGSEGEIISDFYNNPQVYFSTIGLFNSNHELLAVAKLSTPIYKTYTEEALLEIILKY